jgi:hypothetical protein
MNEGTHWGQGYNQPTKGCSAEERPNKRPLTLTLTLTHSNIKFYENPSSGSRVFPCGRTNGQTDMMRLVIASRYFFNAPKKQARIISLKSKIK